MTEVGPLAERKSELQHGELLKTRYMSVIPRESTVLDRLAQANDVQIVETFQIVLKQFEWSRTWPSFPAAP